MFSLSLHLHILGKSLIKKSLFQKSKLKTSRQTYKTGRLNGCLHNWNSKVTLSSKPIVRSLIKQQLAGVTDPFATKCCMIAKIDSPSLTTSYFFSQNVPWDFPLITSFSNGFVLLSTNVHNGNLFLSGLFLFCGST